MTNLSVIEYHGVMVVDSRLIASELGIEHEAFMKTIRKHQTKVEAKFGIIRFEIGEIQGRGQPEKYALLTEPQANVLMTFSRNTERVVDCKIALVSAFEQAKQVISTVLPAQNQEIERLRLQLELAKTQERLMVGVQTLEAIAPGLGCLALGQADVQVTTTIAAERHVIVNEYGQVVREHTSLPVGTVAKQLGMKQAKDLKAFLASCDAASLIEEDRTVITSERIPVESIPKIRKLWAGKRGTRQKVVGES